MEGLSGQFYDLLCNFLVGEPLGLVSAVDDYEGVRAWQQLHRKYSPRTMPRGVRLLSEATRPPEVKDFRLFESALASWEDKLKTLKLQFQEELSNWMRVAVLTDMLPARRPLTPFARS